MTKTTEIFQTRSVCENFRESSHSSLQFSTPKNMQSLYISVIRVVTTRIRRLRKIMFSVFLSSEGRGGGYPMASGSRSFLRGTPGLWSQVHSGRRVVPQSGLTQGYRPPPRQDRDRGTPAGQHPARQDQDRGTPSPRQDMPQTGYAAGRTPLSITQEDFLVNLNSIL